MSRSKLKDKWMRKRFGSSKRNPHRMDEAPKNRPSKYITTHCSADVAWLQEPTSYGGHRIPQGGHRRVSGLVRAKVKREIRKQLIGELQFAHISRS